MELAEGRDVVEAGIGAGVRDHDEPVPHQNSATIGHSRSPNAPEFFGGQTSSQFQGGATPNSRGGACGGGGPGPLQAGGGGRRPAPVGGVGGGALGRGRGPAGPWEDGMVAYNRGDYVPAIRLFRPLAEAGNPKAQTRSGRCIARARAWPQPDRAFMWFKRGDA